MPDFVDVFSRIHGRLPGSSDVPATARWLAINGPGMPLRDVHKRLETLRAKGWVRTYKAPTGNDYAGLVVEPASRSLLEAVHALVQAVPGRSWAPAFHADRPVFLDALHHVGAVAEAARICGLAKSTAYDTARLMHGEATLVRDGDDFRLNDLVPPLHPAVHEAARVATARRIVGTPDGVPSFDIVWHQGPEALVSAGQGLTGVAPGGLDAFVAFGLPFATRRRLYYQAVRSLDPADAMFQAILADPASAQTRTYAALLYEHRRPDRLDEKAAWYGLADEPARIRDYVDDRAEVPGFLPQREYDRLKTLYAVGA